MFKINFKLLVILADNFMVSFCILVNYNFFFLSLHSAATKLYCTLLNFFISYWIVSYFIISYHIILSYPITLPCRIVLKVSYHSVSGCILACHIEPYYGPGYTIIPNYVKFSVFCLYISFESKAHLRIVPLHSFLCV